MCILHIELHCHAHTVDSHCKQSHYAWKVWLWVSYSAMNPLPSLHRAHRRKQSFLKGAQGSMKVCSLSIQQGSDQQEPQPLWNDLVVLLVGIHI